MEPSQNALEIIKEFEGLRLKAYLDPVNIPTIGYGTIRYPNGQRVALGDLISEAEAEAFLQFECDKLAEDVSAVAGGLSLNQNQFDALISFCYNLGFGAFLESTLLRKLKASDFSGAAAEFPRWNKATVDGVRMELAGLTRRRAKERALFEELDANGVAIAPGASDLERVTNAKGFKQGGVNIIVALDEDDKVVEIAELENSLPDTLVAAVGHYPNLQSFDFAKSGEKVPPGSRVTFSGLARPIAKVKGAPKLDRPLLTIGAEDFEQHRGADVKELQGRLTDLGYYAGRLDGVFARLTDQAVRDFQADYFGRAEADGKVGPITWAKLWGDSKPNMPEKGEPAPGKYHLKLTKGDRKNQFGCVVLTLAYYKSGLFVDSVEVCSGQARKQAFRAGINSPALSMEPLPEGKCYPRSRMGGR